MLLLAKLGALAVAIWFYLTAKEKGEDTIKWAIIGLVGYCLVLAIGYLVVYKPLAAMFIKRGMVTNAMMVFVIGQLPALIALASSVLIRKRLITSIPSK